MDFFENFMKKVGQKLGNNSVYLANMEKQGILVSYQWKDGMGVAM